MDNLIFALFFLPILGFAIYGFNCLGERMKGHYLTSEAEETLDELCGYLLQRLSKEIFIGRFEKKIAREVKPEIIVIALKSAKEDLETKGKDSAVFVPMEKETEIILERLKVGQL